MSAPGRPNLSRVLPLMGGALATRRRKGYQGRSPWLVSERDKKPRLSRGLKCRLPGEASASNQAQPRPIKPGFQGVRDLADSEGFSSRLTTRTLFLSQTHPGQV
jgi:hypothetical protein